MRSANLEPASESDPKDPLRQRTAFLRADFAKDRRDAMTPVPTTLVQILTQANRGRAPEDKLFPGLGSNHSAEWFEEDRERAGIDKSNFHGKADFHSLRVTAITLGIELGFDAKTAQTLARHKTVDMTMNVYARINPERIRGAVEKLDQAVGSALSKTREEAKSRTGVTREKMRLAVGAENQPYLTGQQAEGEGFEP